jgi:hypothetical protein
MSEGHPCHMIRTFIKAAGMQYVSCATYVLEIIIEVQPFLGKQ